MVVVRPAKLRDMQYVRRVRNEPTSRRWSTTSGTVGFWQHIVWWCSRSRSKESVYVVVIDGNRAGYVRVRIMGNLAEISVALSSPFQGRGAGSEAIRQAMRSAQGVPHVGHWQARVHSTNAASLGAFESAGFLPLKEIQDSLTGWVVMQRPFC